MVMAHCQSSYSALLFDMVWNRKLNEPPLAVYAERNISNNTSGMAFDKNTKQLLKLFHFENVSRNKHVDKKILKSAPTWNEMWLG